MDQANKDFIMNVMANANDLTLATIRPDGYPQATTVSFAYDGLTLYVGVGKNSQKAQNIRQNNKVSLTINNAYKNWSEIKGLSIGGIAEVVSDPRDIQQAIDCLLARFPEAVEWAETGQKDQVAFLKIRPQVISMLDYTKGFGHTETIKA
ncbi:nitroimidazol reductase NimA-like FMN-containing flavoprotein (pyridoxamine 5'-phosphate oxidase superfamily) [Paucimonas lemoignei]|uniref:Nitroimidazol reductase NimA-like FMN-containing flavoprotein (Pyridoxamine 5'-phosphate oxidase superfamily) n=1 Tax=Paucimonas lemoignei TaxID=29443 RepID=A0A4R3HQD4_PAULE|nr:pyridoxamine 5'-phosphate oxidase family protein [Paucimonas lemoignei]TCS33080.1 nitroimidazol reductase NimA-like FMN-containing flavoprotein (pyridoxamine 5'-phosphate oxidase superfamily) [Paucimonas lemoignei]